MTVDTVTIPKDNSDDQQPGTWHGPARCNDGHRSALIRCPGCGNYFSLANHTIHPDGRVDPSILCPWDDCQPEPWHVFGILEGWIQE